MKAWSIENRRKCHTMTQVFFNGMDIKPKEAAIFWICLHITLVLLRKIASLPLFVILVVSGCIINTKIHDFEVYLCSLLSCFRRCEVCGGYHFWIFVSHTCLSVRICLNFVKIIHNLRVRGTQRSRFIHFYIKFLESGAAVTSPMRKWNAKIPRKWFLDSFTYVYKVVEPKRAI